MFVVRNTDTNTGVNHYSYPIPNLNTPLIGFISFQNQLMETSRGNGTVSISFDAHGLLEVCVKNDRNVGSYGIFMGDNPFDFALPATLFQLIVIITISQTLYFILRPLQTPKFICSVLVSSNKLIPFHPSIHPLFFIFYLFPNFRRYFHNIKLKLNYILLASNVSCVWCLCLFYVFYN